MQRFALLLLAASVALLGTVVPVQAASLLKRETNGERFARGLPPLPPVRRSPTETARRRQVSPNPPDQSGDGRLEVRLASDNTVLGHVANNPTLGPIGLNLASDPNPAYTDLDVELSGMNILSKDAKFKDPYYIGGYGNLMLTTKNMNTIQFTNIHAGPNAAIWTLDSTTGALNATWVNPDNTKVQPTLIFDTELNALNFTLNPWKLYNFYAQVPVTIFLAQ